MKRLITFLAFLASLTSFGQNANSEFDGKHWNAPYKLAIPFGWTVERSLIQKESLKGIEDIRYTPGWGNSQSEQYLSYGFLWYLDGSIATSEEWIEKNLTSYYTGLLKKDTDNQNQPSKKLQSVNTWVTEVASESGDLKTYFGSVAMPNYADQKQITLNCIVHVKSSPNQNKTFVFFEVSPQFLNDKIWKSLDQLWLNFDVAASSHKPKLTMNAYFHSESAVVGQ
ncbi:MAG TPA: hypothetical protein VGQ59_05465 [Cyclobacteriaceae bacterium]|jgi:hypothetical protein|nr:hypothetical protein [Cyclobacteriaceae bacterium]